MSGSANAAELTNAPKTVHSYGVELDGMLERKEVFLMFYFCTSRGGSV
jgi:hypothetical protein